MRQCFPDARHCMGSSLEEAGRAQKGLSRPCLLLSRRMQPSRTTWATTSTHQQARHALAAVVIVVSLVCLCMFHVYPLSGKATWQPLCSDSDWRQHSKTARAACPGGCRNGCCNFERCVWHSGAAAISGEASDSQGEVGSKQLGASAANQTRGAFLTNAASAWGCLILADC